MAPKFCAVLLAFAAAAVMAEYTVVYKGQNPLFAYGTEKSLKRAVKNGNFVAENCVPAGVKSYDGTLYVTVPRWAPGVPSTLNRVNAELLLAPFPDKSAQNSNTAEGFKYVQSMEIDSQGRMWVLETGRQNNLKGKPIVGTPGLVILDLKNDNKVLHRHSFPNSVASPTDSFINDIVVDDERDVAYISDAGGDGAIIVFDLKTDKSHRVLHATMHAEAGLHYDIDGVQMNEFKIPIDGIALTPDKTTVYYNALLGTHLYSVPAEQLRGGAALDVKDHGTKDPSDGLAFGSNGKLYFGSLPKHSVLEWTPGTPLSSAKVIAESKEDLSWPDTFAFDGKGNLLVLSNRLHTWIGGTMSFAPDTVNFRVVSIPLGDGVKSYVYGPTETADTQKNAAVVLPASTTAPAADAPSSATTTPASAARDVAPDATTVAPATGLTDSDTTTSTTTTTSESTEQPSATAAPASNATPKPEKMSPGKRLFRTLQAQADKFSTWASAKLSSVGLPQLSWCSLNCSWSKAKKAAYEARDRVHTCFANTTECVDDIKEGYSSDALSSGIALASLVTLFCWVASLVTDDLSQVDRLWSILPPMHTLHFWSYNVTDPRLSAMAALTLAWGIRLSYNFYRKGGYSAGGEDYRWEVLRKEISNPWLFHLFNLFFVAIIQNILLFALALPAYAALTSPVPLTYADLVAGLIFFGALVLETTADEQQWVFQESKHDKRPRLESLAHDYENGFLTSGLFSYSRHPNFFAEQVIWLAFALFSAAATGDLSLGWWAGAIGLVLLFHNSTNFTEKITLAKYPAYAEYQETTSRLWPLPPVHHPHSE